MERKFKVGDIIVPFYNNRDSYTVVEILDNFYQLIRINKNYSCILFFNLENEFTLVSSSKEITLNFSVAKNIPCPRCGNKLVEKMSVGLGEMIKKCSDPNCGWC